MKIEYDIIDHCNLNCKNCGHFSQFKPKHERSLETINIEINLLTSKLNVTDFRILGGEPLLHTNICNVLISIRNILGSEAKITLVTNGIRLTSMSNYFFLLINALNIFIEISKYPINVDYIKVEELLTKKRIKYSGFNVIDFYNFIDPTGSQNASESLSLCREKFYCPFYDGKNIYLCAYVANVPFANSKYNYNIEQNYISIDEPMDKIKEYLNKPCTTCRFCKSTRQPEKWKREHDR